MKFNIDLKASAIGHYTVKVLDKEGNEVDKGLTAPTENVVTNLGTTYYRSAATSQRSAAAMFQNTFYIGLGEGSIERTKASTDLDNPFAIARPSVGASAGSGFTDNLNGTETYKRVCRAAFPLGAVVGTVSEVGVFSSATGTDLIAGQLLKDGAGQPTTITVLADEQLIVEYTIEWTYTLGTQSGGSGSVTVNGVAYPYTVTFAGIRCASGGYFSIPTTSFSTTNINNIRFRKTDGGFYSIGKTPSRTKPTADSYEEHISEFTIAPSAFSGDIKKIMFMGHDSNSTSYDNPANNVGPFVVIEFDTYLTKTSSDALTLEATIGYSVT